MRSAGGRGELIGEPTHARIAGAARATAVAHPVVETEAFDADGAAPVLWTGKTRHRCANDAGTAVLADDIMHPKVHRPDCGG